MTTDSVRETEQTKMTDEEALLVIFMLLYQDAGKYWYEFEKEIKQENRFFPKAELLKIISDMKDRNC